MPSQIFKSGPIGESSTTQLAPKNRSRQQFWRSAASMSDYSRREPRSSSRMRVPPHEETSARKSRGARLVALVLILGRQLARETYFKLFMGRDGCGP